MIDKQVTKYVASWFARADEDLDIAKLILDEERPYNPACFHEQQAAEKYLKGFLAHHEKHVRKIHDLEALLQECIKIDQSFKDLQDDTRYLGRFYVESRYPDDYFEFTREDAEKGLEAGTRIKEFVLGKIGPRQKNGFGIVGIVVVIAAVALLGGFFGYQYLQLQKIQEEAKAPAAEPPVTPSAPIQSPTAETDTSTWKTYRNEKYGFEVKYPPSNGTIYGIQDYKTPPAGVEKSWIPYEEASWEERFGRGLIAVEYLSGGPLAMPSTGMIGIGIFDNPERRPLREWFNNTFLPRLPVTYAIHWFQQGKELRINNYESLVFGEYPHPVYTKVQKELFSEWERSGRVGTLRSPLTIVFLISPDRQKVVSFNPQSYREFMDQVITTFKFIPSTSPGQVK